METWLILEYANRGSLQVCNCFQELPIEYSLQQTSWTQVAHPGRCQITPLAGRIIRHGGKLGWGHSC